MKNILFILIVALTSCKSSNDFYHGVVTDENKKPIQGVTVCAMNSIDKYQTLTNEKGYFKLQQVESGHNLIFSKESYKTDTIPTVWHQSGETTQYSFIYDEIDTATLSKK